MQLLMMSGCIFLIKNKTETIIKTYGYKENEECDAGSIGYADVAECCGGSKG